MEGIIISFLSGFIISFSGSIAPSSMSAVAMELTIEKSKKAGLWFGLGSSVVEIVYIRLYFLGFDVFIQEHTLFMILQWTMITLFLVIGIIIFVNTYRKRPPRKRRKRDFSTYTASRSFFLGVFLKGINPTQFVFWTFWSAYLIANNWLEPRPMHYNLFCLGLGIATFVGYILYVFLGDYLENRSFFSKKIFKRVIGLFLCATSVAWGIKLLIKPEGIVL